MAARNTTASTRSAPAARTGANSGAGRKKAAAAPEAPARSRVASKPATRTAAAPARKPAALKEAMTKAQLLVALTENTGVEKKQVVSVLQGLTDLIEAHIKPRSVGHFTLPGLLKITRAKRPASKARKGRNPKTGEEIMIPARPARTAVRVRVLKGLKEFAGA
jgi:nucleoid DNA-binding protein